MNRRRTKLQRRIQIFLRVTSSVLLAGLLLFAGMKYFHVGIFGGQYYERTGEEIDAGKPKIKKALLTRNPYSRPGKKVGRIKGVVIHYTANPGSTAMQNRNYFEGLRKSRLTKASSHFIVGLEGEIVQCVPTDEIAYASNERNGDTISIETCHWSEDGAYTEETYRSLVELTAWLCKRYDLDEEDIIRHYDVTGKICPKYFVDYPKEWKKFKKDVKMKISE